MFLRQHISKKRGHPFGCPRFFLLSIGSSKISYQTLGDFAGTCYFLLRFVSLCHKRSPNIEKNAEFSLIWIKYGIVSAHHLRESEKQLFQIFGGIVMKNNRNVEFLHKKSFIPECAFQTISSILVLRSCKGGMRIWAQMNAAKICWLNCFVTGVIPVKI